MDVLVAIGGQPRKYPASWENLLIERHGGGENG